jgi:hypothetical protein
VNRRRSRSRARERACRSETRDRTSAPAAGRRVAPPRSITYGPGGPGPRVCAWAGEPARTPAASSSHMAARARTLPARSLGFPAVGPVLLHAHGDRATCGRRHRPATASCGSRCRAGRFRCGRTTTPASPSSSAALRGSTEELRKLRTNRRLFLFDLLEPCDSTEARQAPELLVIQVCHTVLRSKRRPMEAADSADLARSAG